MTDLAKWGKKMWGWPGIQPAVDMYEPGMNKPAVPEFEEKWTSYRCQILVDMFRDASVMSAIEASPTKAKPGDVDGAASKLTATCLRSAMGISSLAPLCASTGSGKAADYRCSELCKAMVTNLSKDNGLSIIKSALGAGENKFGKRTDAMAKVVNVKGYVPAGPLVEALFAYVAKDGNVASPSLKTNACNPTADDVKKYFG